MLARFCPLTRALLCAAALVAPSGAYAQNPLMLGHPEDYPRADIEHGARIYAAQCDRCHGPDGRGVNGVDLGSGKFSHATTDAQLRNVIANGFPTAGMPAFTFDAADFTGVVAYLRNMNSIDRGSLKPGNFADVAIFDPTRIADRATFTEPQQYAVGMVHVLVNGVTVLRDGEHTGATPGRFVKGPGAGRCS